MVRRRRISQLTGITLAAIAVKSLAGGTASAQTLRPAPTCDRVVTIDVGHAPSAPGATSAAGTPEYHFNWLLAQDLALRLSDDGWRSSFLVRHGENISLAARAARVSRLSHGFLVSIHHDSVQPQFLVRKATAVGGGPVSLHARGYSLFINNQGANAEENVALARAIGSQIIAIPLKPNPSHAEHVAGENRPWVDASLGIYAYNGLAVLRASHVPAVLIEAAVIINPFDEAWISSIGNRKRFADAIAAGLEDACPADTIAERSIPQSAADEKRKSR